MKNSDNNKSQNMWHALENKDVFDNINIVPPRITFAREMALYVGDRKLELIWVGGHSPASIMIYLPQDKVLFGGDNVDDGMPFVAPYSRFGEWIEALKRIETMDVDRIVPGHGGICSLEDVRRTRIFFETACERLQNLIRIGASQLNRSHGSPLPGWGWIGTISPVFRS